MCDDIMDDPFDDDSCDIEGSCDISDDDIDYSDCMEEFDDDWKSL